MSSTSSCGRCADKPTFTGDLSLNSLRRRFQHAVSTSTVATSLAVLLSACGTADHTERATARDSAGVTLIALSGSDDIKPVAIGPAKASGIEVDGEQMLHRIQSGVLV